MKPAEGTILTVSRLTAARAADAARQTPNDPEAVLEAAIAEGQLALEHTTEMNPVLKKAGVVDAGGKGFLVILQGMLDSLRGVPMPEGDGEGEAKVRARPTTRPLPRRRSPSPSTPCSLSAKPLPTRGWRPLRPI